MGSSLQYAYIAEMIIIPDKISNMFIQQVNTVHDAWLLQWFLPETREKFTFYDGNVGTKSISPHWLSLPSLTLRLSQPLHLYRIAE